MNTLTGRYEKEAAFYLKLKEELEALPPIFEEYYMSMRANRKAYSTIRVYIYNILHFAKFMNDGNIADTFYEDVTFCDIERYIISLETKKTNKGVQRMSDDALQQKWSSLNSFFSWLVKRKYIKENPTVAISRPKNNTEHEVTYLTKREIALLFKAVENNPNKVQSLRDYVLFNVALATGLRVSALTNINIDNIDFENNTIGVIEKRQKIREILVGTETIELIKKWIAVRNMEFPNDKSNALFLSKKDNRLSPDAANYALKNYCKEAGIQKKITMHKLRASTATNLAAAGIDLQTISYILGHSNTVVTSRYVAVLDKSKKNAQEALSNLLKV